jgi:hypothetical protein
MHMEKPKKITRQCPEWSGIIDWMVYSIYLYVTE